MGRSGSGDRGGSHPCCLDSLVVSKSAQSQATCVFGDSTDAGQNLHGIQVTDYLLGKLLKSERYDRVLVMCLDRRIELVHAAARQYLEKECEGQTVERCLSKLSLRTLSQIDTIPWAHGQEYSTCRNDMRAVLTKEIKELLYARDTTMTDRNRPIAGNQSPTLPITLQHSDILFLPRYNMLSYSSPRYNNLPLFLPHYNTLTHSSFYTTTL